MDRGRIYCAGAMFNLILYAIPFFVALLAVEWISFRHTGDGEQGDLGDRSADAGLVGYDAKDTATSISMGLGNVIINVGWKVAVLAVYAAVYELTPLRIPSGAWWAIMRSRRPKPRVLTSCSPARFISWLCSRSARTVAQTTTDSNAHVMSFPHRLGRQAAY